MNDQPCTKVEKAINEALEEFGHHQEGDILVEWVVVGYVTNVNRPGKSAYPMLVSNDSLPMHSVRGLLMTGLEKTKRSRKTSDSD